MFPEIYKKLRLPQKKLLSKNDAYNLPQRSIIIWQHPNTTKTNNSKSSYVTKLSYNQVVISYAIEEMIVSFPNRLMRTRYVFNALRLITTNRE